MSERSPLRYSFLEQQNVETLNINAFENEFDNLTLWLLHLELAKMQFKQ